MIIDILIGIAGFALGIIFWFWRDMKIISAKQEFDQYVIAENQRMVRENEELTHYKQNLEHDIQSLQLDEQQYIGKIKGLDESLIQAEENAKGAADRFYEESMKTAQEKLSEALERESQSYQQAIDTFQEELDQIKIDSVNQFTWEMQERQKLIEETTALLKEMQEKVAAAVEAAKRQEEMETQQNFYRIQLSDIDLEEIERLRAVEPYLRNKEALNKVIWKVFYEKPTTDLIGRVIGNIQATGIYKITNIQNQKCYVGQAVNLGDRWKQHIKKGLGADPPTRNKLYPAMKEIGPENFTFEVIEQCDRASLDSREDYWQEYFKAKEFGYSIK